MLKWSITKRTTPSLPDHISNLKNHLDNYDYGEVELYEYSGFPIPSEKIMKDMERAVNRIIKAVRNGEKIIIFGHDDLDGITSTYVLFDFLSSIGSRSHYYYIPNRLREHHGIQDSFVERVKRDGYDLVITVDGGITSIEGVEKLNALGCETIITDHHLVPEKLPNAYAIVNPKQADCPYPYDMLAGAGISFFLVKALAEKLQADIAENYIIWTAIGTIADKAPMTGVNRVLCQIALDRLHTTADETLVLCPGYYSIKDDYFSKMSFIGNIIKLFNNGRADAGENTALYLLLAPGYKKKDLIASLIPKKNEYENTLSKIKKIIDSKLPSGEELCYIFSDDNDLIPYVFLGWAANYLTYLYRIPVIMLKKIGETYSCEARCTDGFNLIEAFNYCSEALEQFGGHVKAAGFKTDSTKIARFKELFREYVERNREEISSRRVITIDAVIEEDELQELPDIVNRFAPYGEGANEPVFLIRDYQIEKLLDSNCQLSFKKYEPDKKYDIVFSFKPDGKYLILDFEEAGGDGK
jgi:single-stranded-DNA-specific exonuclease